MSAAKRMGSLSKLSDFGVTAETAAVETVAVPTPKKAKPVRSRSTAAAAEEKNAPINIKVTSSQQKWLAQTAQQIRSNNEVAVAAGDRVYPQHLIQVAIDLLKAQGVDWQQIKNVEELRDFLNI